MPIDMVHGSYRPPTTHKRRYKFSGIIDVSGDLVASGPRPNRYISSSIVNDATKKHLSVGDKMTVEVVFKHNGKPAFREGMSEHHTAMYTKMLDIESVKVLEHVT